MIETAKQWAITFLDLPLVLQCGFGLLALGYAIKAIPKIGNQWIPTILFVFGGMAGFWIVPMQGPGNWHFEVANPVICDGIRRVAVGLSIAAVVVLLHRYAIRRAEKWLVRKLKEKFGDDDTAFIKKDS